MDFTLKINMDNAAFEVLPEREVAAILQETVVSLLGGSVEGKCRDTNGNTVGTWEIIEA